jgi:PHP family Zn ribbon phosphoesterase
VALPSLIAEAKEVGSASKAVQEAYMNILSKLGNEFTILLDCPLDDIKEAAGDVLAEGINRMRQGKVEIAAGYDGEFGTIKIFEAGERESIEQQLSLF